MEQTAKGSPDGIEVNVYEKGQVYDLPQSLARIFLDAGMAEPYEETQTEQEAEHDSDDRPRGRKGRRS